MTKVKLGDVAIERKQTYKGNKNNIPNVGLEHLTPGEVRLSRWDMNVDNTFTKGFTKGQILLGRRRAYLKKAVIAPFDGICSGDITVIEAIPDKIREDLLPFIIQNDRFFDYATKGSAGSLSPRVKWIYLKDYEFHLPSIEEQEHLAKLLWAAYELKESYKNLIIATDEMVKAQFIEMFDSISYKGKFIGELCNIVVGKSVPLLQENEGGPIAYIKVADMNLIGNERTISTSSRYVQESTAIKSGILPPNTIVFPKNGAAIYNNKKRLTLIETCLDMNTMGVYSLTDELLPEYLYYFFHLQDLSRLVLIGAIPQLRNSDIANLYISVPSIDKQSLFVEIVQQADKSKTELQQSIEKIDNVMKSLLS